MDLVRPKTGIKGVENMSIEFLSIRGFLCCSAYFLAGIIDSITGGGGLITIPVMLATGIPVHFITGTNQCASWLGTGVAAIEYLKSGNIHLKSALRTIPFAILGSYEGARLNLIMPERYLKAFMMVTVPILTIFLFFHKDLGAEDYGDECSSLDLALWPALIGLVLGGYQGFYGPGAGMFFMIAYAAALKLSLVRATGNTRFVVSIASLSSVLTYALAGAVIWNLALTATVFSVIGSFLGARLAIKNGSKIIRPLMFGVIVLLLGKLLLDFF